jgi:hypothetical protein
MKPTNAPSVAHPLPSYLSTAPKPDLRTVQQYQLVPRLKIVQGMSDADLRKAFPPGSAIIRPDDILVAGFGQEFRAVLLFFWPSWEKWRDINDREGPPLVASTLDLLDPSGIPARARSQEARLEEYPGDAEMVAEKKLKQLRYYRYTESLNFALWIEEGPAAGSMCVASFARGGHNIGAKLCTYIMRREVPWGAARCVFSVGERTNAKRQTWYQLFFRPPEEPFTSADLFAKLRPIAEGLERAHAQKIIGVAPDVGIETDS